MTGKIKLYIGLMIIGLAAVVTGLWFMFNPSSAPVIEVPDEEPIITMSSSGRTIGSEFRRLRIYKDGTVICRKEKGVGDEAIRIWSTGQLEKERLSNLLTTFENGNFTALDSSYEFQGEELDGVAKTGGTTCTISISYGDMDKQVSTYRYLTSDDMPYPFGEIYTELMDIIENDTEEVYTETIKS